MRPAVDDVHHRDRQQVRVGAAQVAEELQPGRVGGRPGHRHRHADDRVGAEPRLVRRAVKVDQRLVDQSLVVGLMAEQFRLDLVHHVVDGAADALAAVLGAAVAELRRLERAGGRAGRHARPADGTVVEYDLHLHSGVAPGVQDLPGMHCFNGRHRRQLLAC